MATYKVIENLPGVKEPEHKFTTFTEAKAYLTQTMTEWYDLLAMDPSLNIQKKSDVLYCITGRNAGRMGSIYLKKIQ